MGKMKDMKYWGHEERTLAGLKIEHASYRLQSLEEGGNRNSSFVGRIFLFINLSLVFALLVLVAFVNPRMLQW